MPCKRSAFDEKPVRSRRIAAFALLCLIMAGFWSFPVRAQTKILDAAVLTDLTDSLPIGRYAISQKDPEGKITPASIVSTNGTILSGTMPKGDMIWLGYDGTETWLSVKLYNRSKSADWIIDMGRRAEGRIGVLKDVHAYEMSIAPGGAVIVTEIMPSQSNSFYKITIKPDEQKLILLELKPGAGFPAIVPMKIYSEQEFLSHIQKRSTLHTFYCLILFGFALYFINISLLRKQRSQTIYGVYFAYLGLVWVLLDSVGANIGSSVIGPFLLCTMLIFALLGLYMTKIFCAIEFASFSEKYILYGLGWMNVAATAMSFLLPVGSGIAHICLLYGAPILTMVIICLMSFAQKRNGQLPSNLYLYSWLFPLAGYAVTHLSACGLLPMNFYTLTAFWISIPFQGYFLIRATGERAFLLNSMEHAGMARPSGMDVLNLNRLKETKDTADHTRLLKVIEKEREMLAEFRTKEATRTEEMRQAKEIADEANRAKSAFLAVVSHEIRTPMTGVMGMVRLLLDSSINRQQRDYAMAIQESSEAMLALLNDILDFEKIQRGKIELENISFDLHRLIQGVVTLMSGHATEKGISLSARMSDDLPKFVKGDPTRLRQVLLNLMGNAIKFTEKGSVTLFVKNLNPGQDIASGKQEKHMVYFAVQDTGIGISPDSQKNLFSPFSQASSSISRKFGGTGLGLAISKGLIENMKSAININSKEGEGSTFFFTLEMDQGLSISQDTRKSADHAAGLSAAPIKIIVVDDNSITRKVVTGFLDQGHHDIVGAATAEEALDRINKDAFDLVLMDIELPGMKGNEATRLLREHPDPVKAKLPVIAMTGNVNIEDRERYLADGMSGFVAKPIDPDKLHAIVAEISRKTFEREIRAPGVIAPAAPAAAPQEKAPLQNMEGVFNPEMLQSLKDTIGASSLGELLHDLIVKTEEILAAMDLATKMGDLESLAARAHELKGMAGNFGLVEISSIAAQAEKKAKSNEKDGLDSLIGSLPDANVRAQGALRDWVAH